MAPQQKTTIGYSAAGHARISDGNGSEHGRGRGGNKEQERQANHRDVIIASPPTGKSRKFAAATSAAASPLSKKPVSLAITTNKVPAATETSLMLSPPPGLSIGSPPVLESPEAKLSSEDFAALLAARSLPESLVPGGKLHTRFSTAILSCVEGLYVDRVAPSIGEVQKRLRKSAWGFVEVQAVLSVCAKDPETYKLVPPSPTSAPLVLLRHSPEWFNGWIDDEVNPDMYSHQVWTEIKNIVKQLAMKKPGFRFSGGLCQLADTLQKKNAGSQLKLLSLGELRNVVRLALGPQMNILAYDGLHGGRLAKGTASSPIPTRTLSPPKLSKASPETLAGPPMPVVPPAPSADALLWPLPMPPPLPAASLWVPGLVPPTKAPPSGPPCPPAAAMSAPATGTPHQKPLPPQASPFLYASPVTSPPGLSITNPETIILENLRQRPLPEGLGQGGSDPQTRRQCRVLRSCFESLYRDRIEPTLVEVTQRLQGRGWSSEEAQSALPLVAREPEEYQILMPVDGKPLRVLLRTPPSWFEGWISNGVCGSITPEVWSVLASFLQRQGPSVLTGTITGAAQDLRQLSLPVPMQQMSLGEIREVVRHAIAERGMLGYSGWSLCPIQENSSGDASQNDTDAKMLRNYAQI